MDRNPVNPEAVPISKGWFSLDRANTSYAIVATLAAGLAPPDPFRGDGTAGLADEARNGFGQGDSDREQTMRNSLGEARFIGSMRA